MLRLFKREKKSASSSGSSAKPLTAPSKFKLRLKRKGGAIGAAGGGGAAAAKVPQPLPPASTLLLSSLPMPSTLRARLSALAGSAPQVLPLAAQVASLLLTFYVAVVRLALDLPLSLTLTVARNAAATLFFETRPVAAAAAAASGAATRLLRLVPAGLSGLLSAARKPRKSQQPGCVFYDCVLHHRRLRPARHEFEHRVRMALVDLDAPPRWFSRNVAKAHLSAAEARTAAGLPASSRPGPVWLLTMPPAAGYSQNPISVYYCYSAEGGEGEGGEREKEGPSGIEPRSRLPPAREPVAAVAEVTNTPWGSVARFSFRPAGDSVPKCLHVSPFMDMRNEWRLTARGPSGSGALALSVAASHPELGAFFSATLAGRRDARPRTRSSLAERSADLGTFVRYAYGPQRVALWIYGHAAVLFWRKGLRVFGPPELGAGARRAAEGSGGEKDKKRRGGSNGSLPSSLSLSSSSLASAGGHSRRWHEWVAAKEWPWRVGACGI